VRSGARMRGRGGEVMANNNTETLPREDWVIDPEDDRSWVWVVVLVAIVLLMWAAFGIAQHWWNPSPPVVQVILYIPEAQESIDSVLAFHQFDAKHKDRKAASEYSVFSFGDHVSKIQSVAVVGSIEYKRLIRDHHVPPRCRDVPDGAGCIDWLEPGEKEFPGYRHQEVK